MKKVLDFFLAPFRAGVDFVDARPSMGSVKKHIKEARIRAVSLDGTVSVTESRGDNTRAIGVVAIDPKMSQPAQAAFAQGVEAGAVLRGNDIGTLKRSTLRQMAKKKKEKADKANVERTTEEKEAAASAAGAHAVPA